MGFATEYIDHQNRLHDLWLWTFTQVAQAALAADNAYLLQRGDTYFAMVQTMQTRALETQWRNFWAQVAMAALAKQRGEQEREIEECYAIVLKRSGAVQAVPLPALITTIEWKVSVFGSPICILCPPPIERPPIARLSASVNVRNFPST